MTWTLVLIVYCNSNLCSDTVTHLPGYKTQERCEEAMREWKTHPLTIWGKLREDEWIDKPGFRARCIPGP